MMSIDRLIAIVQGGGTVRTGVDIYNRQDRLLLQKDVLVSDLAPLRKAKQMGVEWIPIVSSEDGGLWGKDGKPIEILPEAASPRRSAPVSELDRRIERIVETKAIAAKKYENAKDCIRHALSSIQKNDGRFDLESIEDTVGDLIDFIALHDKAFSYLTREIFAYDDYLYNHSINVCTVGTVIMKKFNENFGTAVNSFLNTSHGTSLSGIEPEQSFTYFQPEEMRDISVGFFLHDMGKVLIDPRILNKPGRLTESEFAVIRTHSTEKGLELLEKNKVSNSYVANVCQYHHARLYRDEERCYPEEKRHDAVPPYVKVCKLADIYDAMTSRRCYKEALNPVGVVTDIFNQYAQKDPLLQYILHSFVKSVGIYPPGSIIALTNGQLCYVLDSDGPTLLPVTDRHGQPLKAKPDIVVLTKDSDSEGLKVDRRRAPISPVDVYRILPDYVLRAIGPMGRETTQ